MSLGYTHSAHSPGPGDPMTKMAAAAAELHELYDSYVSAGFTPAQALSIICSVLTTSMQLGYMREQP